MAMDALIKPLLRLEIFQGLKPLQITEIARQAERIVFREGDIIVHSGASGDAAYVIVSGEAVCLKRSGTNVRAEPIEAGSLVGELAMLVEHDYSITVVAKTPVRALKLSREAMHGQMRDDRHLAEHISGKITARLTKLAAELRTIDSRLAHVAEARVELR
jgi:CRP-like cAMP-binding protein